MSVSDGVPAARWSDALGEDNAHLDKRDQVTDDSVRNHTASRSPGRGPLRSPPAAGRAHSGGPGARVPRRWTWWRRGPARAAGPGTLDGLVLRYPLRGRSPGPAGQWGHSARCCHPDYVCGTAVLTKS